MTDPDDPPDKKRHPLAYVFRSVIPARPYYAARKATGRPPKGPQLSADNAASQKRLATLYHIKVRAPGNGAAGGDAKRNAVAKQHAAIAALASRLQDARPHKSVRALARAVLGDLTRPRLSSERRPMLSSLSTIERVIRADADLLRRIG